MSAGQKLHIRHHTGLSARGGAVGVALGLHRHLLERGHASEHTYEMAEHDDAPPPTPPERAAQGLDPDAILHLHSSGDWDALLAHVPDHTPLVLTLHDCSLFTGGCPYPLDCAGWRSGCPEPCPRGFADCAARCAARRGHLARLAPALVSPSGWLAGLARTVLEPSVTVIPNGVPDQPEGLAGSGARARARQALGLAPAARMVLFAAHGGERAAYKAGDSWRGLWAAIKARTPQAVGFAVGGDEAAREGDLLLWPYVEPERLRLLLAAADTFVYPTRADNHPLLILEAMAAGAPIASVATGGIPEQLDHGSTGLLAAPGDDHALVDAACALLADPARARSMGNAARAAWARGFTVERMGRDHERLYRTLTPDS